MSILNLVEWLFFYDALYRPLFGVGFALSVLALVLWVRHYMQIRDHTHFVEGISAHI
jgi:hypothetical protein